MSITTLACYVRIGLLALGVLGLFAPQGAKAGPPTPAAGCVPATTSQGDRTVERFWQLKAGVHYVYVNEWASGASINAVKQAKDDLISTTRFIGVYQCNSAFAANKTADQIGDTYASKGKTASIVYVNGGARTVSPPEAPLQDQGAPAVPVAAHTPDD